MSIRPQGVCASTTAGSAPPTVLLVDDTESHRLLLLTSLLAAGYAVEGAADGREALEKSQRLRPDCVLLDVELPDMSGIDVCTALRAHPDTRESTIVMLSVSADNAHRAESFLVGADDYVIKPCSPTDLVARVDAALRRRTAASAMTMARAEPALLEMLRAARGRSLHDVVAQLEPLSTRQLEILRRLLDGDRVPAIARDLYVSASTIRNHLSSVFRKLGVHSQEELLAVLRSIQSDQADRSVTHSRTDRPVVSAGSSARSG